MILEDVRRCFEGLKKISLDTWVYNKKAVVCLIWLNTLMQSACWVLSDIREKSLLQPCRRHHLPCTGLRASCQISTTLSFRPLKHLVCGTLALVILCKSLGDKALLASLGVTTDAGIGGEMKGCSLNTERKQTGCLQPSTLPFFCHSCILKQHKAVSFA